jgi:enoyl-CoA hydratase/carnithine racemase
MLRRVSSQLLDELLASDDAREGLSAFAEKREPQWQGR